MEIQQTNNEIKGVFKAIDGEKTAGKITYAWAGSDKFIIDHTEVNPIYRGQDVGKKLVLAAVDYARKKNAKIVPLCPFAKSVFDKNPPLQDVVA